MEFTQEMQMQIFRAIKHAVRELNGCDETHFALVVWCPCSEGPLLSGSSDPDDERIARMLRASAEEMDLAGQIHLQAGHA